jgi:hypothetical protein
MRQSIKSVPSFPLSPNAGEGEGEGEVIFTEQEIDYHNYEPPEARITPMNEG